MRTIFKIKSLGFIAVVLGRSIKNYTEDRGTQMAASISYYALFSLVPLIVLAVAIFGIVLRNTTIQEKLIAAIVEALPLSEGDVADVVIGATSLSPQLAIISLFAVIWTSGALAGALRLSLNVAFDTERRHPALRGKLVDYALVPILGIPVMGSLILSAFWQVLEQSIASFPFADDLNWIWSLTTILVSLLLTFITFSLFYRFAPNRRIFLRHIWPAALIAAIAFEIMKYAFGVYLSNFGNYDLVYGALGGVVVLLYWVFLSANIFILGAEIANQIPRVLHDQPRRDHIVTTGQDNTSPWRLTRNFLIGLLLDPRDIPRRPSIPSQTEKQND